MSVKILIIDDDPDIVESMKIVLESKNYDVYTASTKEEGWEKVESIKPALVILDVMMPEGTEGFHLAWQIRNEGTDAIKDVPILMLSAIHKTTDLRLYPDQSDSTYAPGEFLPVNEFADKPIQPMDLLKKVEKLLTICS